MSINKDWLWLVPLIFAVLILIPAMIFHYCTDYQIWFFILSGVIVGTYYGKNDHRIFHHPYTKDFYKNNHEDLLKLKIFPGVPTLEPIAQIHIFWVHIISGIIGSIALYLLVNRMYFVELFVYEFDWIAFAFFFDSSLRLYWIYS